MIKTIAGALRAIKRAATPDELNQLAARLGAVAWNDGGAVKQAIEDKRTSFVRAEPVTTYNGWANWETWQINLWLDNEEPLYREKVRLLRRLSRWSDNEQEDEIIAFCREQFPRGTPDMDPGDMDKVNWSEIVESFRSEAEEDE